MNRKLLNSPIKVVLSLTEGCNLNCKHCANIGLKNNELSTKEIFSLVNQLAELKVFELTIYGGEPLLRRDFFFILEYLKNYSFRVSINTNATLITKDVAKRLLEKCNIKNFVVSLDGTKLVHEKLRGKNSFDLAVNGIENLIFYGAKVLISTTITRFNYKNLESIVLVGKKLNVDKIRFNQLYYGGNAIFYWKEISIKPEENLLVAKEIDRLSKKYRNFIISSYGQYNMLNNHKPKKKLKIGLCEAGTVMCMVRSDGYVVPCDKLCEIKLGNIRRDKFVDIWRNSNKIRKFREPIIIGFSKYNKCRFCKYQFLCYEGHRCWPYFFPNGIKDKHLYCLKN